MNNDKLLTLVMRGRDFDKTRCRVCGWPLKQTVEEGCTTESCSMRPAPQRRADEPPDFSDPSHRDEFFTWLTKERPEMWEGFRRYSHNVWRDDSKFSYSTVITDYDGYFYAWLFFSDPARPRDLMAEWLRLEETVERWGWTPCDGFPECMQGERDVCKYPDMRCEGNGKTRGQYAPWARLVQDAKEAK